jgi:hypothetical protein
MHNNESHLTVLSTTRPLHTLQVCSDETAASVCSKQFKVASQVRQEEIGMCSGTINLDCGKADGSAASLSPAIHNCSGTKDLGLPGHRHQGSCAQSRLGLSILPFALHPPAPLLLPSSSLWTRQSTSPQRSAFSCPATHRPVINVIRLRCQLYHRHAPRSKRCDGQFAQLDTVWRELKEASPRTVYGYTAACQVTRTFKAHLRHSARTSSSYSLRPAIVVRTQQSISRYTQWHARGTLGR